MLSEMFPKQGTLWTSKKVANMKKIPYVNTEASKKNPKCSKSQFIVSFCCLVVFMCLCQELDDDIKCSSTINTSVCCFSITQCKLFRHKAINLIMLNLGMFQSWCVQVFVRAFVNKAERERYRYIYNVTQSYFFCRGLASDF